MRWLLVCLPLLLSPPALAQEARTKSRLLLSFETPGEVTKLTRFADGATLETVQDIGVTQGERCLRLSVAKGAAFGSFRLDAETIKNWADFDYLAIDVTTDETEPIPLNVELWDAATTNYATRCTFENIATRPGRQTLLYPIGRPRRNGKEGRTWEELEAKDKINLNALTQVKIFLKPPKDRNAVLYLDNVRLLQEDAAKPRFEVALPADSIAWKFASPGVKMKGFTTLGPKDFNDANLTAKGEGWPDLMTGTFVVREDGKATSIALRVPDGVYHFALAAGPVYRTDRVTSPMLALGDVSLFAANPSVAEYHSTKHLHRFLDTLYSERPHALWLDFIRRMYPIHTGKITIENGQSMLEFRDVFLSALVLTPERHGEAFATFADKLQSARMEAFEREHRPRRPKSTELPEGRPLIYAPADDATIRPWSVPTAEELKTRQFDLQAAPGQRLTVRVAMTLLPDTGRCRVRMVSKSPALPAGSFDLQNYRDDGEQIREAGLLPGDEGYPLEGGITWCWWRSFVVPADAAPGKYEAEVRIEYEKGDGPKVVPVTLEVLPIRLMEKLPLSLGMYYSPPSGAGWDAETRKGVWREQLRWLRGLGFTATSVGTGTVTGLNPDGTVKMTFDATPYDLAREVGFGVHPAQFQMGNTLPLGRAIGRRMPATLGAKVDQNPGIELKQDRFADYFLDACKQYREYLRKQGLPVAVEVVDEPREYPNPWNRNLADTLTYAQFVRKAGLVGFVTPMGDVNNGKDYSVLADAVDVVSLHAYKASEKLMTRTLDRKGTLWFYNTGMDRFSWGFYAWRAGATGRWEWHFSFAEDQAQGGYPGREPHNPFTGTYGQTSPAPLAWRERGAIVHQTTFFRAAEGITDAAYLLTLEDRLKEAEEAGKHADVVREARAFLLAVRRAIPAIPGSKNLLTEADGPLIGMGLTDDARLFTPQWRRTIAGLLVRLR